MRECFLEMLNESAKNDSPKSILTQIKFIFRFGRDVGIFIHKCGSGYVEMRKNILSNSQPSQSLCKQKLITKCLTDLSFV